MLQTWHYKLTISPTGFKKGNMTQNEQIITILGKIYASSTLLDVLLMYHEDEPLIVKLRENMTILENEMKGLVDGIFSSDGTN